MVPLIVTGRVPQKGTRVDNILACTPCHMPMYHRSDYHIAETRWVRVVRASFSLFGLYFGCAAWLAFF